MIVGIHHVAVSVPDMVEARRFYIDVLGFAEVFGSSWDGDRPEADAVIGHERTKTAMLMLRAGNAYVELWQYERPEPKPQEVSYSPADHGIAHFCLQVTDIDAEYERLVAAGMTFVGPPVDLGDTAAIYGRDPFGNIIEIYEVSGKWAIPEVV